MKAKPPTKEATLQILTQFAEANPKAIGFKLVALVQPVAELTCDIKKEVIMCPIMEAYWKISMNLSGHLPSRWLNYVKIIVRASRPPPTPQKILVFWVQDIGERI